MADLCPALSTWRNSWNASMAVLLLALLCVSATCLAQSYHIRTYTEQDGLPSYAVYGVTQDAQGRMWFATVGGVSCYDGVTWKTHGLVEGLRRKGHRAVINTPGGGILAIDLRTPVGLHRYDGHHWHQIKGPCTGDSSWWNITGVTAGLGRDGVEYVAVATADSRFFVWNGATWLHMGDHGEFTGSLTMDFLDGLIYVATQRGLLAVDPVLGEIVDAPMAGLPGGVVHGVARGFDGESLVLVGRNWVGRLRHGVFSPLSTGLDLNLAMKGVGVVVLEDRFGGIYFGDAGVVYYLDHEGTLEIMNRQSGLGSNSLTDLFLDREGNIWIASLRGVSKLVSRRFAGYNHQQGLFKEEVSAVIERQSGEMVLGHNGGLTLLGLELRTVSFGSRPGRIGRVIDLEEDASGTLWIAADRFGLGRLEQDGRIVWQHEESGLKDGVCGILFDRAGEMWVATTYGLYHRHGRAFIHVALPGMEQEASYYVRRLLEGRDGSILVVTFRRGIYRLRGDSIDHWQDPDNQVGEDAYTVHEFEDGRIWVGAGYGLFVVDDGQLRKAAAPEPRIDRPVYAMLEDGHGRVWFGTDAGVMRWDGVELEHLTVEDGLYGQETNRDALVMASDGAIWIGTDSGLWIYREECDLPTLAAPLLEIREFQVDGRTVPVAHDLVLESPAWCINIGFRSIYFQDENRIRFRTWLENFQPDFEPARLLPLQEVRYTNVPPGRYRFHVQAVGADGRESPIVSSGEIQIKPLVWMRWWAITLYILLLLTVLWTLFSYITKRRYTRVLEEDVQARTLELQESERTVRIESQRLKATLLSISDGVLAVDERARVLFCNPAAERLLGKTSAQVNGRRLSEVMEGEFEADDRYDVDGVTQETVGPDDLPAVLRGLPPRIFLHVHPDKSPRRLEICAAAMNGPDERGHGTVLALRDVTLKMQLEHKLARRQKLESLGLLAGGIAHDFNNLLTVIQGNVELAADETAGSKDRRDCLTAAHQATRSAGRLTEQLLTFAKGGKPRLQVSSIAEIVDESIDLALSGANVDCVKEVAPNLWNVNLDRTQIVQAISNVLLNARQAMSDGGTIHVWCRNRAPDSADAEGSRQVVVSVRDEGPGISADDLDRIFDPYFTTKDTGTGLGLTILHSIVESHHGYVEVETRPGCGTTFSIYLPACDAEVEQEHEPATTVAATATGTKGRILVLDDEADIRTLIHRLLDHLGFESLCVADGAQAVAAFREARRQGSPFSAAILDLTIPGGMGGLEAMGRLRQIDSGLKVVVTSGYTDDSALADFRRHGFAGILKKPFNIGTLRDVLTEIMAP